MKCHFTFAAIGLAALLFAAPVAHGQGVPQTLNFQGRLANTDGTPLPDTNAQSITFWLYDDAMGGNLLWEQTIDNIAVHNGLFAAKLNFSANYQNGNTEMSAFANPLFTPYLEIQVGADAPLAPRQPFASVTYAFIADTALNVPDGSITDAKIASVDWSKILNAPATLFTLPYVGVHTSTTTAAFTLTAPKNAIIAYGQTYNAPTIYAENSASGSIGYFTGNNFGAYGSSPDGTGVYGNSPDGTGVYGTSNSGSGVYGNSASGNGVYGVSGSTYAVYGSGPSGVHGYSSSGSGDGVSGFSGNGRGVYGNSNTSYGVYGSSNSGPGTYGVSNSSDGVIGQSTNGQGVYGSSVYGTGVSGYSSLNYAGFFNGNLGYTGNLLHVSDARYKTNIVTLDHALESVLALRGVTYDYRRDAFPTMNLARGKQYGLIAQEVETVLPSLVTKDENGYRSLDYIQLVPVLVEAVKTQQTQIKALRTKVGTLEAQNTTLLKQNKELLALKKQLTTLAATLEKLQERSDCHK